MVRACGSYPQCRRFESAPRYQFIKVGTFPPGLLKKGVLVGLSGGPDSTALFFLLQEVLPPGKLFAAHVNYGLRGAASHGDERFVRTLCRKFRVPLFVKRISATERACLQEGNLQENARSARYAFFAKVAFEKKLWGAAVAHHRNDVAETFMENLLRGAGRGGLIGLRVIQRFRVEETTLRVWRPLLGFSKDEIADFLKRKRVVYRKDTSNQSDRFLRNRIRRDVLPVLERAVPGAVRKIARAAEIFQAEEEWLREEAKGALQRLRWEKRGKKGGADAQSFAGLPLALRRRVIREAACRMTEDARGLSFEQVERIRALWEGKIQGPLDVGFGLCAGLISGKRFVLWFSKTPSPVETRRFKTL